MNSRLTHLITFGAGFLVGGLSTYYYGRYQCRKMREQQAETKNEDTKSDNCPKVIGKVIQV